MRFKMIKSAAGPSGSFQEGRAFNSPPVDEALARAFVEAGSAVWVPEPAPSAAPEPVAEPEPIPAPPEEPETAEAPPPSENAAERTKKPARKASRKK